MRAILISVLALAGLSGCNTVAGVGKDITAVGNGVTGASNYVARNVFGAGEPVRTARLETAPPPPRTVTFRERPRVSVGEACDPNAELAGGSGLPPCPTGSTTYRGPVTAPPSQR